jgi:murein DD-endopeptidase MepM/ murein hydrolase activator NlpD
VQTQSTTGNIPFLLDADILETDSFGGGTFTVLDGAQDDFFFNPSGVSAEGSVLLTGARGGVGYIGRMDFPGAAPVPIIIISSPDAQFVRPRWNASRTSFTYSIGNQVFVAPPFGGVATPVTAGRDPDWLPSDKLLFENGGRLLFSSASGGDGSLLVDYMSNVSPSPVAGSEPSLSADGCNLAYVEGGSIAYARLRPPLEYRIPFVGRFDISVGPNCEGHTGWDAEAIDYVIGSSVPVRATDDGIVIASEDELQPTNATTLVRVQPQAGHVSTFRGIFLPVVAPGQSVIRDQLLGWKRRETSSRFDAVLSDVDGLVTEVTERTNTMKNLGQYIQLRHADGSISTYAHLSQRSVAVGDRVKKGQEIGRPGATGNARGIHLHFQINDKHGNALSIAGLPTTVIAPCGNGRGSADGPPVP